MTFSKLTEFLPYAFFTDFFSGYDLGEMIKLDSDSIETAGDIQDLYNAWEADEIAEVIALQKFALRAYGQISHQEFTALSCSKQFAEKYPQLFNLILIQAYS